MHPVAERLVYIDPERKLYIRIDSVKQSISQRQSQQLKIKVTDEAGKPVIAHLGISVFDTLYKNNLDVKNIFTHYYIDKDLKGSVYNPAFYFDEKKAGRAEALDLLLMTQGWRRYVWSVANMKESHPEEIIGNNIHGNIAVYQKRKKLSNSFFTVFFAPDNKEYKSFIMADSTGNFAICPYDLASANNGYIYTKVTAPEEATVDIKINNPFAKINKVLEVSRLYYPLIHPKQLVKQAPRFDETDRKYLLPDVVVKAKTTQQFRDKYLGYLDSITKADLVTDYVAKCGWLNCPAEGSGTKPIEGKEYSTLIGTKRTTVTSHTFAYGAGDTKQVIYHYPKLTEEELLKINKMGRVKGYSVAREFYNPDYENPQNLTEDVADYRNTIYWKPDIITNDKGEAIIKFYSSDINSGFTGIIEGVDGEGLLGHQTFEFKVKSK